MTIRTQDIKFEEFYWRFTDTKAVQSILEVRINSAFVFSRFGINNWFFSYGHKPEFTTLNGHMGDKPFKNVRDIRKHYGID